MRKKPMLAYPVNNKPMDYNKPTFIQPKLDGVRCLIQYDKIDKLKVGEEGLNLLAIKIVRRMVKLKSMEDWFHHVASSQAGWDVAYKDLELTEEEEALGEAAKLMTLMNMFKEDEEYEKCAIIKGRMDEVNRILRKGKR